MADLSPGQIRLDNVSRRFKIIHERSATLKETVIRRRRSAYTELWALRDVSLTIEPGESVGIVGRNGSGKSTMLKILAGIIPPHSGTVATGGSVAAMLELGAGFHPDFSGRENIFMNAAIHGVSEKVIAGRLDAIVEFAELQDFIDMPVRTYSSGMTMRLAFAVSSHVNPDILLLDEVLAVGDEAFQRKCMGRIYDFKRGGGTLVFVSHDPGTVEHVCDRAVLLDGGEIVFDGAPSEIISRYHHLLADETSGLGARLDGSHADQAADQAYDPDAVLSTDIVHLIAARLVRDGKTVPHALCGDTVTIEFDLESTSPLAGVVVGMSLATESGMAIFGISTRHWGDGGKDGLSAITEALSEPGVPVTVQLTLPALPLQSGSVDVYVAVSSLDESVQYMGGRRVLTFGVFSDEPSVGLVAMDARWDAVRRTKETPAP